MCTIVTLCDSAALCVRRVIVWPCGGCVIMTDHARNSVCRCNWGYPRWHCTYQCDRVPCWDCDCVYPYNCVIWTVLGAGGQGMRICDYVAVTVI